MACSCSAYNLQCIQLGRRTVTKLQIALGEALLLRLIGLRIEAWRRAREPAPRDSRLPGPHVCDGSLILPQSQEPGCSE